AGCRVPAEAVQRHRPVDQGPPSAHTLLTPARRDPVIVEAIMSCTRVSPLVVVGLVLSALSTGACGGDDVVPEAAAPGGIIVAVQPTRLNLLRHVVTATGRVTPHPDGDWSIHAPETSIIADLPFDEGATVAVGDIVVRFDVPSRSSAIQAAEFELTEST